MLTPPPRSRSSGGRLLIVLVLVAAAMAVGYRLGERSARRNVLSAMAARCGEGLPVAGTLGGDAGGVVVASLPAPVSGLDGGVVPAAPAAAVPTVASGAAPDGRAPKGPIHLAVTLKGSLDEAIEEAVTDGNGPALAMVVSRMLVWWMNPARDARPGDKLWIVYALPEGQEPLLLALRYQSQKLATTKTAIRFQPAGSAFARYYDATGAEVEERLVDAPLEDYEQVTSLLRDGRGHKGVDFKVPIGTEVHSPVDGTVTRRNWKVRANGDCVAVSDRKTGRELIFLHLSEVAPGIQIGTVVHKGEVLAKTGNTGHTTAPHLHYQLMSPAGKVLDPFAVQETVRRRLPEAELPALRKLLSEFAPELGPG